MGMTAKSQSNRLSFFWNRSPYFSGLSDNNGQNVVSKSLIFMLPQKSRRTQSWKQSLLHLDGSKTKTKNTNRRLSVTWESDSHLSSSFNLSKSRREKLPKFAWWKSTLFTFWVKLYLTWVSTLSNTRFTDYLPCRRPVNPKNDSIRDAERRQTVNPTWLWHFEKRPSLLCGIALSWGFCKDPRWNFCIAIENL